MNDILFDGSSRGSLLPFTYTRPVAEIRIGILTIREKWEKLLGATVTYLTEEYLEKKFPMVEFEENIYIDASIIPTENLAEEVGFLAENQAIVSNNDMIAFYASQTQEQVDFRSYEFVDFTEEVLKLEKLTDIFSNNYRAIALDFELLTQDRKSKLISATNTIIGAAQVFVEEGAILEYVTINANEGPVYIGKDALVMEGSLIRGPFSLGEQSVVKMGSKIYGGTTIGPNCTVGGEVKNVVMFGNSNKGHDGYLGNSVVGEWCNIGADTNCSNMKNNLSSVKIWNYEERDFVDSDKQFCGLFLGDHSKLGINTMINTGTVIGVATNVFGAGFPAKFIPSFSWGGFENSIPYILEKAIEDAKKMCGLKKQSFSDLDADILQSVFEESNKFRA
jgi:UDP-N-acetylglucosamine diphosphorylase/glucosamine-1-phosphate N-acetyltransferase